MFLDVDSTENTANRRSVDSHATIGSYTDRLRRSQIRTHANVPNEGETFRSFAARVRRKADMWAFSASCCWRLKLNYTDYIIRDMLLNGIADSEICRKILMTVNIFTTAINDAIGFVENT